MFRVVPFGLNIMTGHMQRVMEKLVGPTGRVPFQDDVAVASKTKEQHIIDVADMLRKITYEGGLVLRIKKCKFFKIEAALLGYLISRDGMRMDPAKVKAISE